VCHPPTPPPHTRTHTRTHTHTGLLDTLGRSHETLEAISKSLDDYTETKRVAFPRRVWVCVCGGGGGAGCVVSAVRVTNFEHSARARP
jgi:hypothetical protein